MDPKILKEVSEFNANRNKATMELPPEVKKQVVIVRFKYWCRDGVEVIKWAFRPGDDVTINLDKPKSWECDKCKKTIACFQTYDDSIGQ